MCTCVYIYIYICIHMYMCVRVCVCVYIYIYIYILTYVYIYDSVWQNGSPRGVSVGLLSMPSLGGCQVCLWFLAGTTVGTDMFGFWAQANIFLSRPSPLQEYIKSRERTTRLETGSAVCSLSGRPCSQAARQATMPLYYIYYILYI